jgi:hypothetical protein
MRSALSLLALSLLVAPAAGATEMTVAEEAPVPAVTVDTPSEQPEAAPMHLQEIQLEERTNAAPAADAAQMPARGSFWWLVGVIVVAGVILAVLL